MKKLIVSFLAGALVLFLFVSFGSKNDVQKEEESIKAVIVGEINASIEGDYDRWTSFFVHEPYVLYQQAYKNYYVSLKGWDTLGITAKNWVRPSRKGTILSGANSDFVYRISDNICWVSFRSGSTLLTDCGQGELTGIEVRILEKHEGSWKIAYLGSVFSSTWDQKPTASGLPAPASH